MEECAKCGAEYDPGQGWNYATECDDCHDLPDGDEYCQWVERVTLK